MSERGTDIRQHGFLSWHNQARPASRPARSFLVHDVTLRDGEQQAGVTFDIGDKIAIAQALDELGVQRIEVGRVDLSDEETDSLRQISSLGLKAGLWAVGRCTVLDANKAARAGMHGIGFVVAGNSKAIRTDAGKLEATIDAALSAAGAARSLGLRTTALLADSSRLPEKILVRLVKRLSASWLFDGIALMDSVGVLTPEGTSHLVSLVRGMTDLQIEFHGHNDFGLGVANTIAALQAGVDVAHASMLGLGERVGNTPLEELVVSTAVLYGMENGIDLSRLNSLGNIVQQRSGVFTAANKPVLGPSYSQVESSFMAAELSRMNDENEDIRWLFPFDPALVGLERPHMVVGKFSGSANIDEALQRGGFSLGEEARQELLLLAREEAKKKGALLDSSDLLRLVSVLASRRLGWIRH